MGLNQNAYPPLKNVKVRQAVIAAFSQWLLPLVLNFDPEILPQWSRP